MSMNPPTAPASKGPNWMMIGAAGAVGLGVLTLLMKNTGGGGTTAAGTSINAALGSLQEEQMNTQGQVGLMQQSLGLGPNETLTGHIDANQAATIGAISDLGTQVAGVGSQVGDLSKQSAQQASDASAQAGGFFNQVMAMLAQIFGGTQNIESGMAGLTSGQRQLLIGQALSDAHNQANFDAVQAGLNGQPNPQSSISNQQWTMSLAPMNAGPIQTMQLLNATSGTY